MDSWYFEELTSTSVSSLFIRLMRDYKRCLNNEMTGCKGYTDSSLPVMLSLWGLGGYLSQPGRSDVIEDDGEMLPLSRWFVSALENGVNPTYPGRWSGTDSKSARHDPLVTAGVAFSACICRALLFRRLSSTSIQDFQQWLENESRGSARKKSYQSLGIALSHASRKSMGFDYDESIINTAFETMERCFTDNGGFRDPGKDSRRFDDSMSYGYITFLSLLLYLQGGKSSQYYELWAPRLRKILRDYVYLYSPDGSTPMYGDVSAGSLARLAGPVAGYLAGVWPVKPGILRRMIRLHLNYLMSRGILDTKNGRIVPGTGDPASGRHLQSMQTLGLLMLIPQDDPFWNAREESLPIERGDFVHYIPYAGWLIHGAKQDGNIQLINGGSAIHSREVADVTAYGKFAYSGRIGYVADADLSPLVYCCDNTLSASSDKKAWSHRSALSASKLIGDRVLLSTYTLPVEHAKGHSGPLKVDTVIIPLRTGAQIRIHRVKNRSLGSKAVHLREGGYALGVMPGSDARTSATGQIARAENENGFSLVRILAGYSFAAISQGYEGRRKGHTDAPAFLLPRVETLLKSGDVAYLAVYLHAGVNINILESGDSIEFSRKGDQISLNAKGKSFFEYDFQS